MGIPSTCHSEAVRLYSYVPPKLDHPTRILALEGGGVRGIITSRMMQYIEEQTHQPISKKFDLIASVSTGAIEALALTTPGSDPTTPKFKAEDIVDLYKTRSPEVFPTPPFWARPWRWLRESADSEYSPDGLVKVVQEYCGDSLLKDSLSEVLVLSHEITNSKAWYFQRSVTRMDPSLASLKKVDVIRCATAAPTYFPPMPLTFNDKTYAFIDAGIAANTPSVTAFSEAKQLFSSPNDECLVVTLGTGICKEVIPYTPKAYWGIAKWAPKMIDLMIQSSSELADKNMRAFIPNTKNYFRFQPEISSAENVLDDTSPQTLDALVNSAEELIENQTDQFNLLFEQLADD